MNGLLTDLYELTMAAGYFAASKHAATAVFEMFIRRLPRNRDWVVIAGIDRALDYLEQLNFSSEGVDYLRGLRQFENAPKDFFEYLRAFRFTGDVNAVTEGTALLAGEPVMTIRAPLIEAQIPETYLLSAVTFETLVATKAARMVDAANARSVLEFGTRRAHTPEAGTIGARAAYVGGCAGTSNTLAGFRYGIPVFGTAAHSWVMSFESETEAFRRLQSFLREETVQLVDTYDPIEGARKVAQLGSPLWGVRIDSGDLAVLSRAVRELLDQAGLQHARIMASGDLDEWKIGQLIKEVAPIDAFGVGTELATSADAPAMGMVYKMVELHDGSRTRYTAKLSADKPSFPAAKQIWRFPDHDLISLADEQFAEGTPLLGPVMRDGKRSAPPEPLNTLRDRAHASRRSLTPTHQVRRSARLERVLETTMRS